MPKPKSLPFSKREEFLWHPFNNLLLPSYIKAKAQAMASLLLPPCRGSFHCDPTIKGYFDDEALKFNVGFGFEFKGGSWG